MTWSIILFLLSFLLFFLVLCLLVKFSAAKSSKRGLLTGLGIFLLGIVGNLLVKPNFSLTGCDDCWHMDPLFFGIFLLCQILGTLLMIVSLMGVLIDLIIIFVKRGNKKP
jgi:hypothetical protein